MHKNIVNGIVILDAIPAGDMNTARRLKEDLLDFSYTLDKTLEIRYIRIDTFLDLENGISSILKEIKAEGLIPWLHLEGHGTDDENGFLLAGGDNCSWSQLKELITPLNINTELNTLLILATCFGGTFAKAISTTDVAPVSGLVGPKYEVKTGEVEQGFIAFYKAFFNSSSLKEAFIALQSTAPKGLYYRTSAEHFFYEVWCSYKVTQCTKKEIHNRAKRMRKEARSQNIAKLPSIGHLKRIIKKQEPVFFNKYRDTYFMYDTSSTTRERYPVTYKKAESKCKALTNRPT
ncbi:MAG: hypothetical protein KAT04_14990 [Methylococcales bacterium]|nr:hypothetical protein [Methylococcales bacterium]